jgi:ribulose-5-phosphate 4-epimerase/fuculose-1-phosphate aldolase
MNDSILKQKLTTAYHILHHLGLDDHTYTHISARSKHEDAFYIYPFGLRFDEVCPENLMKISLDGEVLEGKEIQYNRTGYVIHSAVYQQRPDLFAAIHIHTPEIVAVSACEKGLLPLSQWALHFYNRIGYHAYDSLTLEQVSGVRLMRDLGSLKTLLLRNHGSLTCGATLHEALFYTYHLQLACKAQCLALSMNQPLIIPSQETCEQSVEDLLSFEKDLGIRDWNAWERLVTSLYQ